MVSRCKRKSSTGKEMLFEIMQMQVVEAVGSAIGFERVGIRLSPWNWDFLDCKEPDVTSTIELNVYLLEQLSKTGILYVHLVSSRASGEPRQIHS